ncbi:MAG: tetratricopeptide repeat protein [Gemmatimonadota bacterium]
MKIETLKDQARRHEQKEEWSKALDLYKKAIGKLKDEEQPDIGLYNRAGDIQSRIGDLDGAVKNYERAVELYLEAELPNNAIAICKKVLRNLPARATAYLRMGQIRASQGFLTDARQNFLSYAELMQQAGEMEEAFRALIEFTNLAPHDMDIREGVAAQLASHGSVPEAIEQLTVIYRYRMREGKEEEAALVRDQILDLDPEAEIPTDFGSFDEPAAAEEKLGFEATAFVADFGTDEGEEDGGEYEFGEIEIGGEQVTDFGDEDEEEAETDAGEAGFELSSDFALDAGTEGDEDAAAEGDLAAEADGAFTDDAFSGSFASEPFDGEATEDAEDEEDDEEDIDLDLPLMSFDGDDEATDDQATDDEATAAELDAVEAGFDLPLVDDDADPGEEEPLPMVDFGSAAEDADGAEDAGAGPGGIGLAGPAAGTETNDWEAVKARGEQLLADGERSAGLAAFNEAHRGLAQDGNIERAMRVLRELILHDPDDPAHHQTLVEYAYRIGDRTLLIPAFLDLAECLERAGQTAKAKAVYQQVLEVDPRNRKATAGMTSVAPARAKSSGGGEDFLDLGSMVLDEGRERTTRWTVSAQAPSGDEEADFRRLLSQFKAKVAENVAGDDFKAHYDLGTAYKEMGLLDEAIGEFQQALRASGGNLATYELLGQCFMDGDQPEVAVRTLKKALDLPYEVEEELLGIYYYLARGFEATNDPEQALDYYEKVFTLDINFMDATERLRALRA